MDFFSPFSYCHVSGADRFGISGFGFRFVAHIARDDVAIVKQGDFSFTVSVAAFQAEEVSGIVLVHGDEDASQVILIVGDFHGPELDAILHVSLSD